MLGSRKIASGRHVVSCGKVADKGYTSEETITEEEASNKVLSDKGANDKKTDNGEVSERDNIVQRMFKTNHMWILFMYIIIGSRIGLTHHSSLIRLSSELSSFTDI